MMNGAGVLLQAWRHTTRGAGGSLVLPDGCVDLIGFQAPGEDPGWTLSPLMDRACRVAAPAGQRYAGYRLQPGAQVNTALLLAAVKGVDLNDRESVLERLHAAVRVDEQVSDALQALCTERDLRGTLRQLGVSERSLQRLVSRTTGRPPLYWRRLARLRQCARDLAGGLPLADIAADHGFADQAHMNREFRHWLNLTPRQVRQRADVQRLLAETGYG